MAEKMKKIRDIRSGNRSSEQPTSVANTAADDAQKAVDDAKKAVGEARKAADERRKAADERRKAADEAKKAADDTANHPGNDPFVDRVSSVISEMEAEGANDVPGMTPSRSTPDSSYFHRHTLPMTCTCCYDGI